MPGAGGYDAIALLVEDREETLDGLRDLLQQRKAETLQGEQGAGSVNILGVREDMEGVRIENPSLYTRWM